MGTLLLFLPFLPALNMTILSTTIIAYIFYNHSGFMSTRFKIWRVWSVLLFCHLKSFMKFGGAKRNNQPPVLKSKNVHDAQSRCLLLLTTVGWTIFNGGGRERLLYSMLIVARLKGLMLSYLINNTHMQNRVTSYYFRVAHTTLLSYYYILKERWWHE